MKNFFKRLFCEHCYELNCWHRYHGPNGNDPRMIEAEYVCSKCGKVIYHDFPLDHGESFEKIAKEYERRNQ